MDEPWKHIKWKKVVTKDHMLCDSIFVKCLWRQEADEYCPGLAMGLEE